MARLAPSQRRFLEEATQAYVDQLDDRTLAYLESRGLDAQVASSFRLGAVSNPLPGHEAFTHHLSIPYLSPTGVVGMKFRRLDEGSPKYNGPEGQRARMFNVNALWSSDNYVLICEGEIDTITAAGVCGLNAVGIAGVNQWKPHYAHALSGFEEVWICADNDEKADGSNPGQDLAKRIIEVMPHARNIKLPGNTDVNQFVLTNDADALPKLLGRVNHQ